MRCEIEEQNKFSAQAMLKLYPDKKKNIYIYIYIYDFQNREEEGIRLGVHMDYLIIVFYYFVLAKHVVNCK